MGKKNSKLRPAVQYTTDDGLNVKCVRPAVQYTTDDGLNVKCVRPAVQYTTDDGLNVKCVSLAEHEMVQKDFIDHISEGRKQAKQSFKECAAAEVNAVITKGREEQGKGVPAETIAALGSEDEIFSFGQFRDCGMFGAIFTAYSYHYKLRTSPNDWWFCVIKRVACAIDENSQKESVRKMFVEHEGKKDITVGVPDRSIYTVNYSWFFDQITKAIKENVKVPEFVDGVTADFSTTTPVQKIVSQVTLMFSVKQYFKFRCMLGCGIPAVEMIGTEEDWKKLTSRLKVLRTLLEPIENDLGLPLEWWNLVQNVFCKLLETYQGRPDRKWWSHIMDYEEAYSSGVYLRRRLSTDRRSSSDSSIKGWITEFLEGTRHRPLISADDFTSGLVTVPLTIEDPSGAQDTAALVAGMLGFTVHRTDTSNEVAVQPFQGWSLILGNDSPFVKKHD